MKLKHFTLIIKVQKNTACSLHAFHEMFLCDMGKSTKICLVPQVGLDELKKADKLIPLTTIEMVEEFEETDKIIEHIMEYTCYEINSEPAEVKTKLEQSAPRLLQVVKEFIETGYYNQETGTKARMIVTELES